MSVPRPSVTRNLHQATNGCRCREPLRLVVLLRLLRPYLMGIPGYHALFFEGTQRTNGYGEEGILRGEMEKGEDWRERKLVVR